ncbi:MAG TPA: hypothetical protein VL092_01260 [Chitinophagaceae bacterium]|nr:hypothetical protein [Chitinophagaceae bacterium]
MEVGYIESLQQAAQSAAKLLMNISERQTLVMKSIFLKASEIAKVDWLKVNILKSAEHGQTFNELLVFRNKPVLYVIEIVNDIDHELLLKAFHDYTQTGLRAFPSFWNNRLNNKGHKILYVGKVVRNFHGRVIQHMGYHKSSQTQGLQLAHWAALIGVDVKINYCVFEPEESSLMSILEYQLADTLKPLLGKHK